jgi:hypothetical protein
MDRDVENVINELYRAHRHGIMTRTNRNHILDACRVIENLGRQVTALKAENNGWRTEVSALNDTIDELKTTYGPLSSIPPANATYVSEQYLYICPVDACKRPYSSSSFKCGGTAGVFVHPPVYPVLKKG